MQFNLLHCVQAYCPVVLFQLRNDIFICSDCGRNRNTSNQFPAEAVNYFILRNVRTVSGGNQKLLNILPGAVCSGLKRPDRQVRLSHSSGIERRNSWSSHLYSQSVFMARCLIKHTENVIFKTLKPAASMNNELEGFSTTEDGTDRFSRNVCKILPLLAI